MNKISYLGALSVITLAALSGCATNASTLQKEGLTALGHSQLEMLQSRTRTARWRTATGSSGTATFSKNGKVELSWNGGGADGRWRIDGNTLCTRYSTIRNGKETCFTAYRTHKDEYQWFFADGSLDATLWYTN